METNDPLVSLLLPRANMARGMLHATRATMGSLPMVARALLKRAKKPMKIIVDSRANTGSTDCETFIKLPRAPLPKSDADVESALNLAALMYGLIHHEVGHCNHSDIQPMLNARSGLEATLLNIIEDVRMELAHIRDIPNARAYLDALNLVMHRQGKWGASKGSSDPVESLLTYVMMHCNATYRLDPVSITVLPACSANLEAVFSPALRQSIDALLARTPSLQDSNDAHTLAKDLIKLLQQEQQQAQQQEKAEAEPTEQSDQGDGDDPQNTGDQSKDDGQSEGDDQGEGAPSDTEQSEEGQGASHPQDTGDSTDGDGSASTSTGDTECDQSKDQSSGSKGETASDADSSNRQHQDAADASSSNGTGASSNQAAPPTSSLSDNIQQALSEPSTTGDKHASAHDLLDQIVQEVLATQPAHDCINVEQALEELEEAAELGRRGGASGDLYLGASHDLQAAHSASLSIRRKLLSELDARTNAEVWVGKRGRSLSSRHLPRVMTGDGRVFRNKIEGDQPDTAVMLVQDVSSSMCGRPVELASQALYAASLALSGIEGIDVAAMAFPGNGKVLGFGENPRANQQRFMLQAHGGTPMYEALLAATQALVEQPNARQLMIVLTDGAPNAFDKTLAMIASAEAAGIEVYGVGICTDFVQHLFSKWIVIEDVDQLPVRLVKLVRDEVMLSMAA